MWLFVNVQERCCCQQDSLQAYIGWLLSHLSSVDALLAVDSFSLTYVGMTVSTSTTLLKVLSNKFLLAKKLVCLCSYCSSCHKSAKGDRTKLSFQELAVYSLYCDLFMTQLKFYNYHVKHSEIWLVLLNAGQWKSTVWSCQAFFSFNKRPG